MTIHRPAAARGRTAIGWLDSRHTFSFGDYHDPDWMGFAGLRVINDDLVAPGAGFGTHGHRDMEIVTWVLEGALQHRDSTGGGGILRPGEAQRMSAGRGIRHSEFNASATERARFLQVWIEPAQVGTDPSYEQRPIPIVAGAWSVLCGAGGLAIGADAVIRVLRGGVASASVAAGRSAWFQVARGPVRIDGRELAEGDGLGVDAPGTLRVDAGAGGEVLWFDLG
jgi:redox-sensitive bicupin YhaK (pirin superfamily)